MDYRQLGRTGVKVSELCLGCMTFGERTEPEDAYRIIESALDAGINLLDTANVYNRGRSEEVTGEALQRNGKRDKIVLATKVHGTMDEEDPNAGGNSRRHLISECEQNLKRLQTDHIDLYQIHRPQPSVPIDETLRALDDLVRSGKVRYIGSSTFAAWQSVEAQWVSERFGLNRFVTEQPPYNVLDRRIERELLPMTQQYGYGVMPWSPLAGGLLTGKYRKGADEPADGRFTIIDAPHMKRRKSATALDAVERLLPIAEAKGLTLSQLALAWVNSREGVTSPIIGPRTMEQLEDNLGAIDVEISADDTASIDEIVPPGSAVSPFFEADFGASRYR